MRLFTQDGAMQNSKLIKGGLQVQSVGANRAALITSRSNPTVPSWVEAG